MEIKIGGKMLLVIIVLIIIGIIAWSASGYFVADGSDQELTSLDKFAKCLSENGATMYGAEWCGHCKDQKEMFGDSFKYVNYVECPENQQLCQANGIKGYPTWIVNGIPYVGGQSFEKLSELTGCSLS